MEVTLHQKLEIARDNEINLYRKELQQVKMIYQIAYSVMKGEDDLFDEQSEIDIYLKTSFGLKNSKKMLNLK
jgi:hypothetical protein